MLRVLLLSCLVAFAYAKCGCKPGMVSDEYGLPQPNPETGLYGGDMRLTSDNFLHMLGLRNIASNIWPDRVVYYTVKSGDANAIRKALNSLQSIIGNCVRFKERTDEKNYIEVINGEGCWSYVGMTGGRQQLSLQRGYCYGIGYIHHEFIHALGFDHEQCRSDRDKFINIHWDNIESDSCNIFYKSPSRIPAGFPGYDYKSIMHYESHSFSCNKAKTISTKAGGLIGDNNDLTKLDIAKIRALYNC